MTGRTQERAGTEAERVAALAGYNGESYPEDFTTALDAAPKITREETEPDNRLFRHEWDDGSAIVTTESYWDLGVHRDRLEEAQERFRSPTTEGDETTGESERPLWTIEFVPLGIATTCGLTYDDAKPPIGR